MEGSSYLSGAGLSFIGTAPSHSFDDEDIVNARGDENGGTVARDRTEDLRIHNPAL